MLKSKVAVGVLVVLFVAPSVFAFQGRLVDGDEGLTVTRSFLTRVIGWLAHSPLDDTLVVPHP